MWDGHVTAGKIWEDLQGLADWKSKVTTKHDTKKIQTGVSSQMIREKGLELQCRQSSGFK